MTTTTSAAGDTGGIYVLAAHPHWRDSRVNRRMLAAARGVPGVDVNDLYGSYPDFAIDVEAEQARLAKASLVVLLHPIQWYSMPALQKLWIDDVLSYGWAYGPGGTALQGKDFWLVATTGSPEASYHPQSYHRHFFDAFLPPYEQTAALCGMRFLPPLVFHGARGAAEAEVAAHVDVFTQRLGSYPRWPELEELDTCVACPVPETDRPAEPDDMDKVASGAFHSATARGLASMSAANEEKNNEEGLA
ncbi:putative glutathione-regulated potassium-efflux system protein KefC [Variovorax paradoxus B4]|uniref:Putative glutathione-regulated potassium-efflux system protein KefC n=1 Tax=Variovorax paradoxus B4 TaxID=1246301 RepID=T1XHP9_VARPD|nr:NAD(P)H-dependent oxidoreductase [Variovorax paradoxus]AGU51640.1 putative glutathione-regulated potassium-efflux system protein KefC [Variovorax paradoxus B4]